MISRRQSSNIQLLLVGRHCGRRPTATGRPWMVSKAPGVRPWRVSTRSLYVVCMAYMVYVTVIANIDYVIVWTQCFGILGFKDIYVLTIIKMKILPSIFGSLQVGIRALVFWKLPGITSVDTSPMEMREDEADNDRSLQPTCVEIEPVPEHIVGSNRRSEHERGGIMVSRETYDVRLQSQGQEERITLAVHLGESYQPSCEHPGQGSECSCTQATFKDIRRKID
uniref:Uncharacterized protein n=1 Tax=Lactuca sativa TaxID=4236 RepID=A0A9R1UXT1_LACSA|nr:hypothetical protein LSAT_V11C700349380 [Lactuca sativa]